MNLQWKFDAGESDPEWLERGDEERAELRAEGLQPSDRWIAEWRDLVFVVAEQQEPDAAPRYVLRTTDWADDVAYHSEGPNGTSKLPRLGKRQDFATLAEAQQYAQKMCDDMGRTIDADESERGAMTADDYQLTDVSQIVTDDDAVVLVSIDSDGMVVLRVFEEWPDEPPEDGIVVPDGAVALTVEQARMLGEMIVHAAEHLDGTAHDDPH
jgi:hypothetical protein